VVTIGGSAVSSAIRVAWMEIVAGSFADATTNNASRRLPGPRSLPLDTIAVTSCLPCPGAARVS
jgi:hypothetical protein